MQLANLLVIAMTVVGPALAMTIPLLNMPKIVKREPCAPTYIQTKYGVSSLYLRLVVWG